MNKLSSIKPPPKSSTGSPTPFQRLIIPILCWAALSQLGVILHMWQESSSSGAGPAHLSATGDQAPLKLLFFPLIN